MIRKHCGIRIERMSSDITKGVGRDPSIGAVIACRSATGEVEVTGGFWDGDAMIPWSSGVGGARFS